jgi:hypothetical protein
VYASIIININGLNIMVTLISVYFEYINILSKYLPKILCPYYKFIHTILLYFLKSLQVTFIIIIIYIILYIYINYML